MGMRGIMVGMRGIGLEWNRNRKRQKKVYKIQFFVPEIEKEKEIRIVIKR